uniref:Uncharacterized protein n=1 Tax=Stomoxys calcitrans TaxID=35570 RepID=A0A454A0Q2_STOCA
CIGERGNDVGIRCAISHRVDQAGVLRFRNGNPARSRNERCFRACVLAECNFVTFNGSLKTSFAMRAAPLLVGKNPSQVRAVQQLLAFCQQRTTLQMNMNNICDYAEAVHTCIRSNNNLRLGL